MILGWNCLSRDSAFAGVLLGQSCTCYLRGFSRRAVSKAWRSCAPTQHNCLERDSLSISFTSLPLQKHPLCMSLCKRASQGPVLTGFPLWRQSQLKDLPSLPSSALSSACLFLSQVPVSAGLAQVLPGLF